MKQTQIELISFRKKHLQKPESALDLIPSYLPKETQDFFRAKFKTQWKESIANVNLLFSEDVLELFEGLVSLCCLQDNFSFNYFPPPEQTIPTLISIGKLLQIPLITYLVARAIKYISNENTNRILIVQNGGLQFLIQLLDSPHIIIAEQASASIASLVKDTDIYFRLYDNHILLPLIRLIQRGTGFYLITQNCYLLEKFCYAVNQDINRMELKTIMCAICQLIQSALMIGSFEYFFYFKIIQNCTKALTILLEKFDFAYQYLLESQLFSIITQDMIYQICIQSANKVFEHLSEIIFSIIDFIREYFEKYLIQNIQELQQNNEISKDLFLSLCLLYYKNAPQYKICLEQTRENLNNLIQIQLVEKLEKYMKYMDICILSL